MIPSIKGNVFEKMKLIVFLLYNLTYVIYMTIGKIPRAIYLGLMVGFICLCLLQIFIINREKNIIKNEKIKVHKNNLILFSVFFLFIIGYSILIQIINGNIQTYLYSASLYLLLPFLLAYSWIVSTEKENRILYFYILFSRYVLNFMISQIGNISIEAIKSITWSDSKSSIFESSLAHDFLFFTIIFLNMKKRILAFLSTILCLLSFKRLSFILAIAVWFIMPFLKRGGKVNKSIIVICIILICIAPIFYGWMITPNGQHIIGQKIGIDLDDIFTGRIYDINRWLNSIPEINGYGSISHFINIGNTSADKFSLHCDLYQLYLECSIVSVFLFANFIINLGKKNRVAFFMVIYIVIELIVSQFFNNMSTFTILYMYIFYLDILKVEEAGETK